MSPYSQREINRFFETTGVCWYFPDKTLVSEVVAGLLMEAFSQAFGIQARDLGVGLFHCKQSPLGMEPCQGVCIFDATNGSLRLTEQLAQNFGDVIDMALDLIQSQEHSDPRTVRALAEPLRKLKTSVAQLKACADPDIHGIQDMDGDWVSVVSPGEKAMYTDADGTTREVEVEAYRYAPLGLVYDLIPMKKGVTKWTVAATAVQPIYGTTALLYVNFTTGETRPMEDV